MIEFIVPAALALGFLLWVSGASGTQPKRSPILVLDDDNDADELTAIPGCRVFRIGVHGESFANEDGSSRQQIIATCRSGDSILLVPEPTNKFDHLAIRVCTTHGRQIGYLPAGHGMTKKVQDGRVEASIDKINTSRSGRGLLGVVLKIAERTEA